MKTHKKLAILASCAGLSVLLAGTSACSLIASAIYGEFGSKGTSVIGTHTMTMSKYDEEFLYSTDIDSAETGTQITDQLDFYCENEQTNTLVLNSDGTYQLTKKLVIDVNKETDDWTAEFVYTFYGSYTYSGTTVTLGMVESITYTATNPGFLHNRGHQLLGSELMEKIKNSGELVDYSVTEKTTELNSPSGFFIQGASITVIDLWYGAYLHNTGKGNVEQTVTIGSYDWGDFTFSDDGLST